MSNERESKMLEALALVELYPGDEFRIAGSDTPTT